MVPELMMFLVTQVRPAAARDQGEEGAHAEGQEQGRRGRPHAARGGAHRLSRFLYHPRALAVLTLLLDLPLAQLQAEVVAKNENETGKVVAKVRSLPCPLSSRALLTLDCIMSRRSASTCRPWQARGASRTSSLSSTRTRSARCVSRRPLAPSPVEHPARAGVAELRDTAQPRLTALRCPQTVENCFYFSFLIREQKAAIEIDDDPDSEFAGDMIACACSLTLRSSPSSGRTDASPLLLVRSLRRPRGGRGCGPACRRQESGRARAHRGRVAGASLSLPLALVVVRRAGRRLTRTTLALAGGHRAVRHRRAAHPVARGVRRSNGFGQAQVVERRRLVVVVVARGAGGTVRECFERGAGSCASA